MRRTQEKEVYRQGWGACAIHRKCRRTRSQDDCDGVFTARRGGRRKYRWGQMEGVDVHYGAD
jgi:hypothetical protein